MSIALVTLSWKRSMIKIFEIMDSHPDAFLIVGGDFNACRL